MVNPKSTLGMFIFYKMRQFFIRHRDFIRCVVFLLRNYIIAIIE